MKNKAVIKQELKSGDDSINFVAGENIFYQGVPLDVVERVALDIYIRNAVKLNAISEMVVTARVEQVTKDFLVKFLGDHPEAVGNLADPDVQNTIFEAQRAFARSGEEDLEKILVDLLVGRGLQNDRSLRTLALNEAILSAPKLTENQRRAIGLIFLLRYSRATAVSSAEEYYRKWCVPYILPLAANLPEGIVDYQHIEYVGAGAISISSADFATCIKNGVEGLFTRGFAESDLLEPIVKAASGTDLIIQCKRDPERLQMNILAIQELAPKVNALGLAEHLSELERLLTVGQLSPEEVLKELITFDARFEKVAADWSAGDLGSVTLTSVGIVLGHAYWKQVTGASTPLSIWL